MIGWNGRSHQTGQYSFKWASERGISTAGAVLLAFSQTAQSLNPKLIEKKNSRPNSGAWSKISIDLRFIKMCVPYMLCFPPDPIWYSSICMYTHIYIYTRVSCLFIKVFFSECQLLTTFHQTSPLFELRKTTTFAAFFNASSDKSKISSAERYLKSSMIQGISFELANKTPISSTDYHPTSHNLGKLQKMSMFHLGSITIHDFRMMVAAPRYWLRECWWIRKTGCHLFLSFAGQRLNHPTAENPWRRSGNAVTQHSFISTSEYEGIQPVCWGTWQSWRKLPHIR